MTTPIGTITPEGRARLRAVQQWLRECPDEFRMRDWVCGTACCIGGKAAVLAGFVVPVGSGHAPTEAGLAVRGVPSAYPQLDEFDVAVGVSAARAHALYYVSNWPADLQADYRAVEDLDTIEAAQIRASLGIERIERFLAEHDAEARPEPA